MSLLHGTEYGGLSRLANRFGTDKGDVGHGFTHAYEAFLRPIRHNVRSVLEVGIGFGASLRMWASYFPNATIYGWDKLRTELKSERIVTAVVDQEDEAQLRAAWSAVEYREGGRPMDLIVDDGGHKMAQQITTFRVLFPLLSVGGLYILEDLHTSLVPGPEFGVASGGHTALDMMEGLGALVFDGADRNSLTAVLRRTT
jgi:cephalosporin hydroxylase